MEIKQLSITTTVLVSGRSNLATGCINTVTSLLHGYGCIL